MISISSIMDAHDIAQEIRLERQVHKGSFLLLEGLTDIKRFKKFIEQDDCSLVNCFGKKNLIGAIELLYDDGFPGALGLVDADFDRITNKLIDHEGIIFSNYHDFDLDWACCGIIDFYLEEVGDQAKCLDHGGGEEITEAIKNGLKPLSVLRFLNEHQSFGYNLKNLNHVDFFKNFQIDIDSLVGAVFVGQSSNLTEENRIKNLVNAHSKNNFDLNQLTNGHDFNSALGIVLRTDLGGRRPPQSWGNEVGIHFRLIFSDKQLLASELFKKISLWENENKPYLILARRLVRPN